mmetsp:Transcript_22737/g.63449  ORF Transcript_22737/g.63449 Transcript_22737/m.63449 type:complete len:435 (+) Transcript_22737:195-1499(+)
MTMVYIGQVLTYGAQEYIGNRRKKKSISNDVLCPRLVMLPCAHNPGVLHHYDYIATFIIAICARDVPVDCVRTCAKHPGVPSSTDFAQQQQECCRCTYCKNQTPERVLEDSTRVFETLDPPPHLVLEDEDEQQSADQRDETEYALLGPCILLGLLRLLQLLNARLGMLHDRLHVVIDTIQDGALIDDEHREFLEDGPELLDGLRDLGNLLIPRLDGLLQIVDDLHLLRREEIAIGGRVEIDAELVVAALLLRLHLGQVLALRLSERDAELLQLLGQVALHVGADGRLLTAGAFRRGTDLRQHAFDGAEFVGDVLREMLDLSFHVLQVLAEDAADAAGVQAGELVHEALDFGYLVVDGIDRVDPDRRGRCVQAVSAAQVAHLDAFPVLHEHESMAVIAAACCELRQSGFAAIRRFRSTAQRRRGSLLQEGRCKVS